MDPPIGADRDSLILDLAGVYSSCLLRAKPVSERDGVPSADMPVARSPMKTAGGQEDVIEDVALNIAKGP